MQILLSINFLFGIESLWHEMNLKISMWQLQIHQFKKKLFNGKCTMYTSPNYNSKWYLKKKREDINLIELPLPLTQVYCPVGWGCKIHWLHLCRGVRPPLTSVLYMTLNNLIVRFQWCWSFGDAEHLFIDIAPRSTVARNGSIWSRPIYGLNRTNCILMLNWIVWIRTAWLNWIAWSRNVLHKLYLYLNCMFMLNWIAWNGNVFDIETVLKLNWIV